ncbi:hypothetical protein BDY17DRAFT_341975 [Neohortaea acidophila]|uniref:ML-like domain-containing protein n=1 Tax=Neohortaea acidophila TaxID=245834 RepID=A0A6A6Q5F1_9PEZI|nr:uncharacterized protein BDY17DRAFT_341975 [Neohortaea acidophila]KAF2487176.1 hypothetical protein BDY17DRAFT_341975 [Neohortaea acidophila]
MWPSAATPLLPLLFLAALPAGVLAGDVLETTGFSQCVSDPQVQVTAFNVQYNKNTRNLVFDLAGTSKVAQKVTAELVVSAYGKQIYTRSFDPCSLGLSEICPVPAGTFSTNGELPIPSQYASEIPAIAFSVPDLAGNVKMELKNSDGQAVGCIESTVGNGSTLQMPVISYVAGGIALAALVFSGIASIAAGGHPGASTASPTFGEVVGHFQGVAMTGMLSVNYPQVYRSFTTNFAFSTGLISWGGLQNSIDSFRKHTGGNLTDDNYPYLKNQATLVYNDGTTNTSSSSSSSFLRRGLDSALHLAARQSVHVNDNGTSTSIGSGSSSSSSSSGTTKQSHLVSGIEGYAEALSIPQANTFMTILLVWAIIVAAIIVGILLFKVILEAWGLCGKLPKSLESWRKRYWWRMAKAIVNLILILYGAWTLWSIYQFTAGDSWAAQVLAGVTWGVFTLTLAFFTWRIWRKAQYFKKLEGDTSGLYEDKETWVKYSLFYDNFQKKYWLFFVPVIVYMFARGCVIAGANGHGTVQVGGQLIVEAVFLILLLWTRPYQRKSGKWINIVIHVVRVVSVACILVFVEELGIAQTTQTIVGVILIVVQAVLTVVLAILIAVNALITCIKENPHRRARKEAEKANMNRDFDNLTPLDPRNSMLMEPMAQHDTSYKPGFETSYKPSFVPSPVFGDGKGRYDPVPAREGTPASSVRKSRFDEHANLVSGAASMGMRDRSTSQRGMSPPRQQPRLPDVDFGYVDRR